MPGRGNKKKKATAAAAAAATTPDKKPEQSKNNGPKMSDYNENGTWKLSGHHKSAQELADIRNAVMLMMATTKADANVLERLRMQAELYQATKVAFDCKHPPFDQRIMDKFHALRKGRLAVTQLEKELKEEANVPSVTVNGSDATPQSACIGVEDGSDYSDGE